MPDEPLELRPLSATRQKQLDLQIKKIKKQRGFDTKAHWNWPGSLERRQQARAWRIRTVETYPWAADIITGKPVENQADLDGLLNDPATIDLIGRAETANLLVDVFNAIAGAYLSMCSEGPEFSHEEFCRLLEPIRLQAAEKCRPVWPDRGEWFDRWPVADANAPIDAAAEIWRLRALDAEIEHLASGGTSPRTDEKTDTKAKVRKKQKAVVVGRDWLITKLNEIAKKKGLSEVIPSEVIPSELVNLPGSLAKDTWKKLFKEEPVRSDVPDHLLQFFKLNGFPNMKPTEIPVIHVNED
jgi:hypothetical protein